MTGRTYFYHLKFELYNKPLAVQGPASPTNEPHVKSYLPPPGTNIFSSNLPNHPRAEAENSVNNDIYEYTSLRGGGSPNLTGLTLGPQRRRGSVIDCGPQRSDPQKGSPPHDTAHAGAAATSTRTLEEASRDWRFGRVRVESIQIGTGPSSQDTSVMAAGSKLAGGGMGPKSHATKARFEPLTMQGARSTELGWGIVHLYRDGEETLGLGEVPAASERGAAEAEQAPFKPDIGMLDTTILCIPAVPSYMTASDFLGWVGEKTRDQVSHFRMVMTGRMNRYMMLMKFRDGKEARRWRAEWDGKVFNGMEVSSGFRDGISSSNSDGRCSTAGKLPCNVHQIHRIRNSIFLECNRCHELISRHVSRPLHTNTLRSQSRFHCNKLRTEASSPTNTIPRRTSYLSGLSRTHGRHNRSPHHPLPARLPLRLSSKMARFRLSRLSTRPACELPQRPLRSHSHSARHQPLPSLRLCGGPVDLSYLRQCGLRKV